MKKRYILFPSLLIMLAILLILAACANQPVPQENINQPTITTTLLPTTTIFTSIVTNTLKAPTADFTTSQTLACIGDIIQFTNKSTGDISSYVWDFGDSTTSAEQNPTHDYYYNGKFTVSLTVSNSTGESSHSLPIEVLRPVRADFHWDAVDQKTGTPIHFKDISGGDNRGIPTSWLWDFGDGSQSTEQNPVHSYQSQGDFKVTFTAGNGASSDTISRTIGICNLEIITFELCSNITTDGQYTIQPNAIFKIGDPIWVYIEVKGFYQEPVAGGYEYDVLSSIMSFTPDNTRWFNIITKQIHETKPQSVETVFIAVPLTTVSPSDAPGQYRISILVNDTYIMIGQGLTKYITIVN